MGDRGESLLIFFRLQGVPENSTFLFQVLFCFLSAFKAPVRCASVGPLEKIELILQQVRQVLPPLNSGRMLRIFFTKLWEDTANILY